MGCGVVYTLGGRFQSLLPRPLKRRRRYGNIPGRSPLLRGPVAQGIEQRFPGPCVAGSNPARPALRGWPNEVGQPLISRRETATRDLLSLMPPATEIAANSGWFIYDA